MTKSCAFVFITSAFLMLLLQSAAQDDKTVKTMEKIPFLYSEADRWSFQHQMKSSIKLYMQLVETKARKILSSRYKFDGGAKMPDYQLSFDVEQAAAQRRKRRPGILQMENGLVHNINNISLYGDHDMDFLDPNLVFTSKIYLFEYLKFVYEFNVSRDGKEYNGTAVINIADVRYTFKTALNINTTGMRLLELRKECTGEPIVEIHGIQKEHRRLKSGINKTIADIFKGPIFGDIEVFVRTVLQESLKKVSIRELLPKVDFKQNYGARKVSIKKPTACDAEESSQQGVEAGNSSPLESVPEPLFVQNTAEKWAFWKQMNKKMEEFMKHMSFGATNHIVERELQRAKLADDSLLISILDKTSTKRYAPLSLSKGWMSSEYNFYSSRVRFLGLMEKTAMYSADLHLLDPVEFELDFSSMFLRDTYRGSMKGSMKSLVYQLNFMFDLEKSTVTMAESEIACLGEVSLQVTGLDSEDSWFLAALRKSFLEDIHETVLLEIHKILSGTFDYVASTTAAKDYLPEWNYDRNYRWDLEFRISELDDDEIGTCNSDQIEAAIARSNRFLNMIGQEGKFREPVQDKKERYFTHISGVKKNALRYISTKTQTWYLDFAMRNKMNEYMYHVLEETKNVILSQDLDTARMPDLTKSLQYKGNQILGVQNSSVKGLASIEKSGVDVLEYDQNVISLTTSMLVYRNLQFEGDYTFISAQNRRSEGKITAEIPSVVISFAIENDYRNSRTSKVDYLKIECMGGAEMAVRFSPQLNDSVAKRASDVFTAHLKEKVIEDVLQILRRSMGDAILKTNFSNFLPEWDYERDYITDIIKSVNQNRFQTGMNFCDSTEPANPTIRLLYPDEETVEFSDFLPKVRVKALRRSFQRQIHNLMAEGVNTIRRIRQVSQDRLNPPRFADSGITFDLEDDKEMNHRYSMIFSSTGFDGLRSPYPSDEIDFAYGKNDTIVMLHKERWDKVQVNYSFTLRDENNTIVNGSAQATAEGLEYLIKARFYLRRSAFSVEEYFLHCIRNFTVNVQGLGPEWDRQLESIKEQVTDVFTSDVLPEIKELLFVLYGNAARRFIRTTPYPYGWTYYEELFKIAEQNVANGDSVSCDVSKGDENNGTLLIRSDIPFISTEAEWWSFSTQMKTQMNIYMEKIKDTAKEFIRFHMLGNPVIPNLNNTIARVTRGETQIYNVSLTQGIAVDPAGVEFANGSSFEFGEELIITSYLTFEDNLKLSYDMLAVFNGDRANGKILAEVKSLKYKMVIHLNFGSKTARMVDFKLSCMRGFNVEIMVADKQYPWLNKDIPDVFRDDFKSVLQRDIKKIMHLAFNYGVLTVDASQHIIQWNYKTDYRLEQTVDDEQRKTDFRICA